MRVLVLMDLAPDARYARATVDAIGHAAAALGRAATVGVACTDAPALADDFERADGVVIGPGSPYRNERAVWDVVRSARERGVPLVGT